MAYLTNKIGQHEFISLMGLPIHPTQRVAIDDRPGVTGSEIMLMGFKGEPFTLISAVDTASYSAAHQKYNDYRQMPAESAVELVIGSVSSYTFFYAVKVLKVEPIEFLKISTPVGNKLNAPSLGWCSCRWDLLGVPLE